MREYYGIRDGSAGGTGANQYRQLQPNNSDLAKTSSDIAAMQGIYTDTMGDDDMTTVIKKSNFIYQVSVSKLKNEPVVTKEVIESAKKVLDKYNIK